MYTEALLGTNIKDAGDSSISGLLHTILTC